jgi:rRNA maturation protein Nop10
MSYKQCPFCGEKFKVDSAQQSVVNSYHTYRLY